MRTPEPLSSSASDNNSNIEKALLQYDSYIVMQVKTIVRRNFSNMGHPELLDLEIDEIIQLTRIRLWHALEIGPITNYRGYIQKIIKSVLIDRNRQLKPLLPLPTNQDGELNQGSLVINPGEGMGDPEQEIVVAECITETVQAVSALPHKQQQAMLCSLGDRVGGDFRFAAEFRKYRLSMEEVQWSENKAERQRSRACLWAARQKVAQQMGINLKRCK